jgi:hypothetical protein
MRRNTGNSLNHWRIHSDLSYQKYFVDSKATNRFTRCPDITVFVEIIKLSYVDVTFDFWSGH